MNAAKPEVLNAFVDTNAAAINSAFYIGNVYHKRFTPKVHSFNYSLYMSFIDLDEVQHLEDKYWWFSTRRWSPLQIKASDYFKDTLAITVKNALPLSKAEQLKETAINVAASLGAKVDNITRVCMLAQLRSFGVYFSPVNFFFLYENESAKYLLAEVSNTPWNKKHCYLINIDQPEVTAKAFHVSPFMDLDMVYKWVIKPPTESALVRIENWNDNLLFSASFSADRCEINPANIRRVFIKWPVIATSIVRRIYWQAAKLFLKGIRYVPYSTKEIDNS